MIVLNELFSYRQCIDVLVGLLRIEVPGGSELLLILSWQNFSRIDGYNELNTISEVHNDRHMERLFLFAMMWSLGAVLELDGRLKMAEFMTKLPVKMDWPGGKGKQAEWAMPFDFVVSPAGQWQYW